MDGVLYQSSGKKLVSRLATINKEFNIVNKKHKLIKLRKGNILVLKNTVIKCKFCNFVRIIPTYVFVLILLIATNKSVTPSPARNLIKFGGLLSKKYFQRYLFARYKINHDMCIHFLTANTVIAV